MGTIMLAIVAVLLFVITLFLIPVLLELRKTAIVLRDSTEKKVNPALDELQLTLKSLRGIADNVHDVTNDVKEVADAINEFSRGAAGIIDTVKASVLVRGVSLKAGLAAGMTYLLTNLLKKGDRQ